MVTLALDVVALHVESVVVFDDVGETLGGETFGAQPAAASGFSVVRITLGHLRLADVSSNVRVDERRQGDVGEIVREGLHALLTFGLSCWWVIVTFIRCP